MENEEIEDTPSDDQEPRQRSWGKALRACLRGVGLLIMIPIVFALIAALMLIGQDVTAPTWVTSKMEARASTVLDGGELNFEDIKVNLGKDLHPTVKMEGVTLIDADGTQIAGIESVTGLLSPRGVVFERRALLQDVVLTGIDVDLRRDEDGVLALRFGGNEDALAEVPDLESAFAELNAAFSTPTLEALEYVEVSDLRVTYLDQAKGIVWQGQGQGLQLDLRGEQRKLSSKVRLQSEFTESETDIRFSYVGAKDSLASEMRVDVLDVAGNDLANALPVFEKLTGLSSPLTFSAKATVDAEGHAQPISANLSLGEGEWVRPDDKSIAISQADIGVLYDLGASDIDITNLELVSDRGSLDGTGRLILQDDHTSIGQFQLQNVSVLTPDILPDPIAFEEALVDLRVQRDPLRVDIGQFVLLGDAFDVIGDGQFESVEGDWTAALDFDVPEMAWDQVMDLWPESRTPNLRRWLSNNLLDVRLSDMSGVLRLGAQKEPLWSLGADFDGLDLRVFKNTPSITEASGYASFAQGAFGVTITDGYIPAESGGQISIAGSTIDVPQMRVKGGPMSVNIDSQSSITAVLSILEQSPLKAMQKAGLPVAVADGRAALTGSITFPRVNPVPPDRIEFNIDADLSRVASTRLIPNRDFQSSALTVKADNSGMRINGAARLDGAPMNGTYAQVFGEPGSTLEAEIEISPQSLAALDIDLPPGTISGSGVGDLSVAIQRGTPPAFNLTSNLRGIRVAVPPVGWSKSPNADGALSVSGTLGRRPEVTDLRVSGGGLAARGRVSLTDDGQLEAARFSQLQIGNWFNAPLTLRGRGAGRPPAVEINGGGLDLRRASFGSNRGESGPVEIALDRLQVTSGIAFSNFRGSFNGAGGFNGSFSGNLNGGPSLQGTVVPQNGRSAIRLRSDDAGGIARAAGFLKGGTGGSLDLVLSPAGGEGTFDGALTVRQLRVREAPAMAALLDAISVVGLLQQLDGQGLSFEEVDARFRLSPSQVVVSESSAVGPGLGISLDGVYSLASKQLDFQGVISPFYLFNGIGSVLTRKGEGLIGFNFTVRGDTAAPQVAVNPLSALTPGMFREIFRRAPPELD